MSTTIDSACSGRLGNQIIRNLAVSIIAEKYNLNVNYSKKHDFIQLGIELFSGSNVYANTQLLTDDNYFSVYNCGSLENNIDANHNFFQTKEIINLLYNYLHAEKIRSSIIEKNPFNQRYNSNNDLFIHVRLTDAVGWNPGINYYLNAIKDVNYENLYIATDEKTHNIIKEIVLAYPNAKIVDYNEIETIQFGSSCKNIILSHGSFSAVIGYLAFFSNIYYPEFDTTKIRLWHGDMFSIKDWIKCSIS